jgi:hypothetical protein
MHSNPTTVLHPRTLDLTGQTFHYLTVKAFAGYKGGRSWWLCQCQCGTLREYKGNALLTKNTHSCGCFQREKTRARLTTHGQTDSPEYRAWCAMRDRCTNQHNISFKNYGQRGIEICSRWDSFAHFLEDMGRKPTTRHSLERLDNNKGYSAENCVWATRFTQAQNTRRNLLLTHDGITQCLSVWAREKGIKVVTLFMRLQLGWSIEDALTIPVSGKNVYKKLKKDISM